MVNLDRDAPCGAATPSRGFVAHDFDTSKQAEPTPRTKARKAAIRVRVLPDGDPVYVPGGRQAETMRLLIQVGAMGFTKGEASIYGWARHTGDYVMRLRRLGIPIGKRWEETPDGARIARYFLEAIVKAVPDATQEGAEQ